MLTLHQYNFIIKRRDKMPFCIANKMNCGCLAGGTKIQLADGRNTPIENIRIGERIANPLNYGDILTIEYVYQGLESDKLIQLKYGKDSNLVLTAEHPVYTTKGVLAASKLKAGDQVLAEDSAPVTLTKVSIYSSEQQEMVYNLSVSNKSSNEDSHFFTAAGLVVGDMSVQQNLMCQREK